MEKFNLKKYANPQWLVDHAIYIVLLLLILVIIIREPNFLHIRNFRNILSQSAIRMIIALGVGGILIIQGTDLSAGRQVGLAAVLTGSMLQATSYAYRMYPNLQELPIIVPVLIAILATSLLSGINGVAVSVFKVPAFIATLGMQIVVYGITSIYFDRPPYGAQPIGGFDQKFTDFVVGKFFAGTNFEIPYLVVYAMVVIVFIYILWNKTRFGKNMYAIGGNPEAATVSGVNVRKYIILVYILAGILYGFGGFLEAGRVGSATNNTANMYELDAIAACVVGGVSTSGGIGTVPGILTGVLIFTVINYGLTFMGVSTYLQYIIKGLIIITAVAIDIRKYIRKN